MRRTVAFAGPDVAEAEAEAEAEEQPEDMPPPRSRGRSSTFSEGIKPALAGALAVGPAPPSRSLSRAPSVDADLQALQRLFGDGSTFELATPGRSLLWEGRCACLCLAGEGGTSAALPDHHVLLLNDALVWAKRSASTIASPLRPVDFRVLRMVKVRAGFEMESPVVGHLKAGSTVTVVERRQSQHGKVRARLAASVGVAGGSGG